MEILVPIHNANTTAVVTGSQVQYVTCAALTCENNSFNCLLTLSKVYAMCTYITSLAVALRH